MAEHPRIYFGREPSTVYYDLDVLFKKTFRECNYNIEIAVEQLIATLQPEVTYHTHNLLIPNYLDDAIAAQLFWIIDERGNHIHMFADESMQQKLTFMGPGEVLVDDARSFTDNSHLRRS